MQSKSCSISRDSRDKHPFFLTVSFTHPHSPFIARQDLWDPYRHEDIDMPQVGPIPLDQQDEMSRWLHFAHGGDLDEVAEEHVRNARHAYYAMITYIDAKVGTKSCRRSSNWAWIRTR